MESVKRPYRQKARAEKAASTRRSIVEAAVRLHESVGPAQTSLSAVAREAGISRPTLYAHFADEEALFRACTEHWLQQDPPPDPAVWLQISDPVERVATALSEIYSHYARNEQMIENVFRDMYLVDSMRSFNVPLVEGTFAAMTEILSAPFADRPEIADRRRAMVSVAISFDTWQRMVGSGGLSDQEAANLMAGAVVCVGESVG